MRPQVENLPGSPDSLTVAQLADYVQRQLQNIASSVTGLYEGEGEVATVAPPKPRESMYKWADGASWNPAGVGKGPVVYSGSAWLPLYSTPTALLNAIKTVDGAGSGLDADALDGLDSSYFLNAGNLSAGTLPAARMPALTGDVTTTVGTVATTIGANKVTLAMLATMATGNVLGRNSAGTGNVELLPFAESATASTIAKRDINGNLVASVFIANSGVVYLNGALTRYLYFNGSYYELAGAETGVGDGSTSRPGLMFLNDTNTGLYRHANDGWAGVAGGSAKFYLNTNGFGAGVDPASRNNCSLQTVNSLGFPATQVASSDANALDDYEEGTWTPTVSAGSGSFTSVSAAGRYTKIGHRYFCSAIITITTNGTAGSFIQLTDVATSHGSQQSCGSGRETAALGYQQQVIKYASDANVVALRYDNQFPTDGNNGRSVTISWSFEV